MTYLISIPLGTIISLLPSICWHSIFYFNSTWYNYKLLRNGSQWRAFSYFNSTWYNYKVFVPSNLSNSNENFNSTWYNYKFSKIKRYICFTLISIPLGTIIRDQCIYARASEWYISIPLGTIISLRVYNYEIGLNNFNSTWYNYKFHYIVFTCLYQGYFNSTWYNYKQFCTFKCFNVFKFQFHLVQL